MVLKQLDIRIKKKTKLQFLASYSQYNAKWIIILNVKSKIFLEENRKNTFDSGLGQDFFVTTLKAKFIKENTDKLEFVIIKNFCSSNDTVKGMKRHTTDWKKIFANHMSNKELVSRTYKELWKLNNTETKTQL